MADQADRRAVERRQSERRAVEALDFRAVDASGHLSQGGAEIIGYRIEAPDGYLGRAADFCIEEESSVVTGLLVTTRRRLLGGRRIFVPLSAIERIDSQLRKIYVRPLRDELAHGTRRECRSS